MKQAEQAQVKHGGRFPEEKRTTRCRTQTIESDDTSSTCGHVRVVLLCASVLEQSTRRTVSHTFPQDMVTRQFYPLPCDHELESVA